MSVFKSNVKTDLSAIYRLEFYKKQTKWKLSHEDMKLKRKSSITKKNLNRTYRIDSDTNEKKSVLNDGFLMTPGDTIPTCPELDQPLSESLKLTETPANTLNSEEEILEEISPAQNHYMWLEPERDEQICSNAVQDHQVPLWHDAIDQEIYNDIGAGEDGWYEAFEPDWPTNPPAVVQQRWLPDREELVDQVQQWAEPYYPPDVYPAYLQSRKIEIEEQNSVGSFTEFSRGAHLAPHSSEVELVLDTGNCTCDCTSSSVGRASESELRARAGAHVAALSTLFTEILVRNTQKLSHTTSCSHCPSHRTAPNADWSLMNPPALAEDSLLSLGRGRGRGRGRLREAQPLIRIGMGRPYRCT